MKPVARGRDGPSVGVLQQRLGAMHLLSSLSEPLLTLPASPPRSSVSALLSAPPKPQPYDIELPQQQRDELPDLHDDLILEVLAKLDGHNRHAVSACCSRLRSVAASTFSQLTVPVLPALTASSQTDYAAAAGARMALMTSITLLLPQVQETGSKVSPAMAAVNPAAMEQFLADCLAACPGGALQAEVLRIKGPDAQATSASCPVTYAALSKLAAAAPKLRRLSLPLLSCPAAAALPAFAAQLSALRLVVSDSPTLDHVLQLPNLRHLSISTRKGLLYLVLSQRQIANLAQMSNLQTLALQNVLINDCRASWAPLMALTSLQELSVSSPMSPERLEQLPASLRVLQLPFFAGSLDSLASPDMIDDGSESEVPACRRGYGFIQPVELHCKQAFTEQDLKALGRLPALATLRCDNIVVMEAATNTAQAALAHALATGASPAAAAQAAAEAAGLPVLRSVTSLQLTGYHTANGLLGVLFPNLEVLQVTSVTVPRPAPAHMAVMPHLRSLDWPSCGVLPALLAACPEVASLSVTGINCQQRLEELVQMSPPAALRHQQQENAHLQGQAASSAAVVKMAAAAKNSAGDDLWWPKNLCELSLCFSSSVRFRPKQVVSTLLVMPSAVRAAVRSLSLRDQAQTLGPGRVVDDAVLAAAVRSLPSLQRISLADSGAVTDAGLRAALAEAQPGMATVVVTGCPKVSRSNAERIAGELGRPWLHVQWTQASSE